MPQHERTRHDGGKPSAACRLIFVQVYLFARPLSGQVCVLAYIRIAALHNYSLASNISVRARNPIRENLSVPGCSSIPGFPYTHALVRLFADNNGDTNTYHFSQDKSKFSKENCFHTKVNTINLHISAPHQGITACAAIHP